MRWNGVVHGIGVVFVVLLGASGYTPLWNTVGGVFARSVSGDVSSMDAIIVLSGSLLEDGTLNHESWRRTLHGIGLHQRGLAPLLVLSGGGRNDQPTEAARRAMIARDMGVGAEALLLEETARSTHEEALRIGAMLRARRAGSILLVTESLHMRRAVLVFEAQGFQVLPAPADAFWRHATNLPSRLRLMVRIFQESTALVYYWSVGYI